MTEIRSVQRKLKGKDLRKEFHRGLEEFMRRQLDDCMQFEQEEEEEEDVVDDQLMRRSRHSDIDQDDLAESSAVRLRQSRILSRWAARQAEEMITTLERRNRESELMALARLHTVSTRDSTFPVVESESQTLRSEERSERVRNSSSSILQMWRELEDEHIVERARERRVRDRLIRQERLVNTNTNLSSIISTIESEGGNENGANSVDASESEDFGTWSQGNFGSENGRGDHEISSREQSPDIGESERERVRQIARGWTDSGVSNRDSDVRRRSNSSRANWLGENERERVRLVREWVQMNSQQRGNGDGGGGRRGDERSAGVTGQIDRIQNGLADDGQQEHLRSDSLRVRGRQAFLDLLARGERERERELQCLLEYRAVSQFAHRNRIQALLRGRFLRSGRPTGDERPLSVTSSELGFLSRRNTVSGLREGFWSRLENTVCEQVNTDPDTPSSSNCSGSANVDNHSHSPQEFPDVNHESSPSQPRIHEDSQEFLDVNHEPSPSQSRIHDGSQEFPNVNRFSEHMGSNSVSEELTWQEPDSHGANQENQVSAYESRELEQSTETETQEVQDNNDEEIDGTWQEYAGTNWLLINPGNEVEEDSQLQAAHENWPEDESQEAVNAWPDSLYGEPQRTQIDVPIRRISSFDSPDDDNSYNTEIRELLRRRSVSNLLDSEFRESLDHIVQSYVERQRRAPGDEDLHITFSAPILSQQDQEHQIEDQDESQIEIRPFPLPPPPPPHPLWHRELRHASWPRQSMQQSEYEWDIINDLRADVVRLKQGMSHMQRMLEACMDMQLELQRSVRQEVSAALNRSTSGESGLAGEKETSEDNWVHVKKGICCVCCDSHINSLLYRCGHMCTCSKCAVKLFEGEGKCPLCLAPIVEVIRAYSIL